jgi:hypothetical protein
MNQPAAGLGRVERPTDGDKRDWRGFQASWDVRETNPEDGTDL